MKFQMEMFKEKLIEVYADLEYTSDEFEKILRWIKNNFELINVGVTRAKNKLVIAGDLDAITALSNKDDDLYNLVQYAIKDGNLVVPPNETIKIEIGKSNNSKNEDEFFKTLSHFCSVHSQYEVKRNVPFKVIFKDDYKLFNSEKEFDIVIYEKRWTGITPSIAIELCGGEHLGQRKREISDMEKKKICEEKGIKYLMIDNSFIKAYEYIKDLIIGSKDKKSTQISLFELEEE